MESVTATSIVQQTRDERRRRELARHQNEAVIKLQAFLRGTLSRLETTRFVTNLFDELVTELNSYQETHREKSNTRAQVDKLTHFDRRLCQLLRALNWFCRSKVSKERLLAVCRLLLGKIGRATSDKWLSSDDFENRQTFARTLRVILNYLAQLPIQSPSHEYAGPLRVLENAVIPSDAGGNSAASHMLQSNRAWLYQYLAQNGYFRVLCQFVDGQVPPTAGYLTTVSTADSTSKSSVFDPAEFARVPRVSILISLFLAPIHWADRLEKSTGDENLRSEALLNDLLSMALNNILAPNEQNQTKPTERIVLGLATRLLDSPTVLRLIPHLCCPDKNDPKRPTLIPSINLLYLLTAVVVPKLLSINITPDMQSSATVTPDSNEGTQPMDVADPEDTEAHPPPVSGIPIVIRHSASLPNHAAASLVCAMAQLLMQALHSPGMPCIRPLRNPKPLVSVLIGQGAGESDASSDEEMDEGATGTADQGESHGRSASGAYEPAWPSQLTDVFTSLRRTLPPLASSALLTLDPTDRSTTRAAQSDLVCALAQLHYALDQIYDLPMTAMVALNSIYSQHPAFIRALWKAIEHQEGKSNFSEVLGSSLFHLLCTGELPQRIADYQSYLPLLFTFAVCLHHRLLCLTDAEISGLEQPASSMHEPTSGCGFHTQQLLTIGSRFRDLMLGLIDLSHPDQLPKYDPLADADSRQNCGSKLSPGKSENQAIYKDLFERIEQRIEAADMGERIRANGQWRNRAGWSPVDLRIQLHCWTSLFRRIQRLVFQIYDWDRRSHRQSLGLSQPDVGSLIEMVQADTAMDDQTTSSDRSINRAGLRRSRNPMATPTQAFWFKESIASSIDSSIRAWLQHGGDRNTLTLAGASFGYYSRLNPDWDKTSTDPFMLSNMEVRQVLILKEIPFVVQFERRVRLFQLLIESSRAVVQGSNVSTWAALASISNAEQHPEVSILVRRTHLYEDAFDKLSKENESNLQPRFRVRFINQVGAEEAGVDGGGLSRDFLSELLLNGFDPTRGFFVYTTEKTLYPNPYASALTEGYLAHYYFLGRMLAKALYEGMLVELRFAHFFLAKIASRSGGMVGFDYLHSLDPELYRHLRYLKTYTGDVRNLALDFTVTKSTFGQSETVELKPDGRQIPVTEENRVEYIHLVAYYKLNKQIHPQVRAFTAGLNDVICIDWLRMFDADEFQTLISGADKQIDIDDLQKNTSFVHDTGEYHETLQHFWAVLRSFSEEDKRLFLRFVTACSRPPMFGFRDLQPQFSLQITDELDRLPTASTCMNLLRLPNFRDPELIRQRLLYALHANAGFEYS